MADDALQFVARKHLDAAARHADGGVAGGVAGGEGVDAALVVEDIDLRHGDAGGDGHFLDDIEQLAFVQVGGVLIHQPPAHQSGHGAATGGQLVRLVGAAEKNHRQHAEGRAEKYGRVPQDELDGGVVVGMVLLGLHAGKDHQRNKIDRDDEQHDGDDKIQNEPLGLAAGLILAGEEVHRDLRFWIYG